MSGASVIHNLLILNIIDLGGFRTHSRESENITLARSGYLADNDSLQSGEYKLLKIN
jgi:hypothetical protein